jgi:glucosamine--fructose-6-phosphate aminotransferase (isomerizing)
MCGIVGAVLNSGSAVAPVLHEGLRRLEYRGYDSVGIATLFEGGIEFKKDAGKIAEVHARLNLDELPGSVGIGHTRWATHGNPSKVNAHPHFDCSRSICLVHNGIIENFLDLKQELVDGGHLFESKTDTEVIAHLIEAEHARVGGLEEAVLAAVRRLEGSYALAVISAKEPDRIVLARNESPLVIGVEGEGIYCASDVTALLSRTRTYVELNNREIATLERNMVRVRKIDDGSAVQRSTFSVDWTPEMAEKGGQAHFMLKEIYEQPNALRQVLRLQRPYVDVIATLMDRAREVYLVAAGTSYHACLAGSYMFTNAARRSTIPSIASEFIPEYGDCVGPDSCVLAVSQSGETADVLQCVQHAKLRAATVLGLANVLGSTLTRVANAFIMQQSGPEIGVAATKTFTSQLAVLAQLACALGEKRGKIGHTEAEDFRQALHKVPDVVEHLIAEQEVKIRSLARKFADARLMVFLGRGISSATAMEARLKLLEIAYVPSVTYPAGESKHGPISLIEPGVPVVFVIPKDQSRKAIIGNVMEMKARGASILSVIEEGDEEVKELSDEFIEIPTDVHPLLSPIVYVVPLQLFAYHMSVERGLDPDKPRNLAKSVTVT